MVFLTHDSSDRAFKVLDWMWECFVILMSTHHEINNLPEFDHTDCCSASAAITSP